MQKALGGRADDVGLREVDVHIHETRRDDAARQVRDPLAGELAVQCLPGTSGPHALAALGIGGHGEQAVFVIQGRALIVKAQQRRAVDVHGLRA